MPLQKYTDFENDSTHWSEQIEQNFQNKQAFMELTRRKWQKRGVSRSR
jgi:hypothetical protein